MYTKLMIYFLLCAKARIFTVEELQDLPINISSILSPSKIIDYDLDSSYIGISDNRLNSRRESVLKLLKSDSGYIIEASNRFITVTMNNKIVLTRNVTRASEFKIISRGPGFSLQVGSKCLFNDRDRLKLTTCEDSTLPWRKSQQVWMICLLPNSMLRLFYEMCEDDDCDQDYTGKDVDFSNLFEKSIVDNSLSDSLVPFLKINNYLKKKEKICKNRARCYEECTCKCN